MVRCDKVLGKHGNYLIGRMPKIKQQMPSLSKALVNNNQRALLMCKPDALFRGLAPQIIKDVSLKLDEKGISHRLVAPKIFQMTLPLSKIFYDNVRVEQGDKVLEIVTQYASGTHPDPRVPQAPMIAFIVEARVKEGEDLIKILRADDMIGPTSIKEKTLTEDPARAENIKKSLRYKYTLGMGVMQKPFEGSPGMNCIHCSSNADAAKKEISTVYQREELNPYYHPDALDLIYQDPDGEANAVRNRAVSIPFQKIAEMTEDKYKEYVTRLSPYFKYRDFDGRRFLNIHDVAGKAMQITLETGQAYFKSLVSCAIVNVNGTAAAIPRLKKIIGISGFTGSGKSTAIQALMEKGNFERIVLVTTRAPRTGEVDGKDYIFVSQEKFTDMLSKEQFIASEEKHGECYGILKDAIEDAVSGKKDIVYACGPNMINDVREYLRETGLLNKSIRFSSIMIKLPGGTEEDKKKLVISHIKDRSDAQERTGNLTPETINRYESFAPQYDLIIESKEGMTGEVASQILKHATILDNLSLAAPAEISRRGTHWERVIVGSRFKILLTQFEELAKGLQGKELQEIEDKLKELQDNMNLFFFSIKKVTDPEADMKGEMGRIKSLTDHTSAVIASLLQLSGDYLTIMRSERRFGKLQLLGSAPRFKMSLDEMKAIDNSIKMNNKLSMALLHDIGKLTEMSKHSENSYELLKRLALYRWFKEMSKEDRKMNRLAILYHTILGSFFLGNNSYKEFHDMFSNPIVREMLSTEDGKVNLPAVQKLLSRVLLITFIDVAGSGDETGALTNTKLETYFQTFARLFEIFTAKRHSYDEALKAIEEDVPKYNLSRIGLIIGSSDLYIDSKANPIESYKQLVASKANDAIKSGVFSENDWKSVEKNFHLLKSVPYSILNLIARVHPAKKEIVKGLNENFTDSILKLLVVISKILTKDPSRYAELNFLNSKGENLINMRRGRDAAIEISKALNDASVKMIEKDGKTYLAANDGSIINKLEMSTMIKENGILEINVKLNEIKQD